MDEIVIKGKSFPREEVQKTGERVIKRKKLILRIISASVGATGLLAFFTMLFSGRVDETTGETIPANPQANAGGAVAMLLLFLIPAIILLLVSLKKKDPIQIGTAELSRHFPSPVGFDGKVIDVLEGDKTILLARRPLSKFILDSKSMKFQLLLSNRYSKIYGPNDLNDYEIKVDNEIVVTSKTKTKKGIGKAVAGGLLFGGVGAIAGAAAGNSKSKTTQTQKEIHHYSLVLKINDLSRPSYLINIDSAQIAEEIVATLDIFSNNKKEEVAYAEEVVEVKEEKPANHDYDKFEEIKKYKELLDGGIITQEEFDIKKKEILG